jgi:hypothetical protein
MRRAGAESDAQPGPGLERSGWGSHKTGWTGIVARIMHLFATTMPEEALAIGKAAAITEVSKSQGKLSGAAADLKLTGRVNISS